MIHLVCYSSRHAVVSVCFKCGALIRSRVRVDVNSRVIIFSASSFASLESLVGGGDIELIIAAITASVTALWKKKKKKKKLHLLLLLLLLPLSLPRL